jgi:hypothetical protein
MPEHAGPEHHGKSRYDTFMVGRPEAERGFASTIAIADCIRHP